MAVNERDLLDPQHLALPAATLGLAVAGWAIAARQMGGTMDMGSESTLGSFGPFCLMWTAMTAAMMLPGIAPFVVRASGGVFAVPRFLASYLAVWSLVGLAVYALYRPHGAAVAGRVTIAAGLYELSGRKRRFRSSCQAHAGSGTRYGLTCLGSCAGLMLALVALDPMSLAWMCALSVVIAAQKLLPANRALDVPVGLTIIAIGAIAL